MAGSPRVVAADLTFQWDGVPWRLQRGQVIDVPPGSALEQAIGAGLLEPLYGTSAAPQAAQAAPEPEEQGTPEGAGTDEAPASWSRARGTAGNDGTEQPADGAEAAPADAGGR